MNLNEKFLEFLKNNYVFIVPSTIFFLLDQGLKHYFLNTGNVIINKGIALSVFHSFPFVAGVIHFLGFCLLLFLCIKMVNRKSSEIVKFITSLLFSASISNMVDRIRFNGVVDYISVPLLPTANLSDYAIIGSLSFIVITMLYEDRKKTNR